MAIRLFIGNLAYDVTEVALRAHFAAIGPLSYLSIPLDHVTGKPRGFAFVEFSERADAEEAIRRLHNQMFQDRQLAVSEARPRDDRTSTAPPRGTASRPAPAPSPGDNRNFGPDAMPRRKRKLPKGPVRAERGPKRPMRKCPTGPVRFDTAEDAWDDTEEDSTIFASRRSSAMQAETQ
jgi:RNA recognition motif-containing protein